MASLVKDPNGRKRIQFLDGKNARQSIRLGKLAQRQAEGILHHVEELLAASLNQQPMSRETALWLDQINDKLRNRLAKVKLCQPRHEANQVTRFGLLSKAISQNART